MKHSNLIQVRHIIFGLFFVQSRRNWSNPELSSVALGGKVVKVSDEFFAEAFHLLEVEVSSTASASLQYIKSLSTASSQPQRAVWP